jgi:ABC-type dipeptide/oligopeptide/nickel transport system permease subunit
MKHYIYTGLIFGFFFGLAIGFKTGYFNSPENILAVFIVSIFINAPVGALVAWLVVTHQERKRQKASELKHLKGLQ